MQITLSSTQKMIAGVLAAVFLLGGGYYFFSSDSSGQSLSPKVAADTSLLSKDVQDYLKVRDKLNLSDLSFTKKQIYPLLIDYSQTIPLKVPEGRSNPFAPYVTP